jgi:flavin-dependent dehydrogenase
MSFAHQTWHDVVVVGGRVAGAATAMLLARDGHDVVVLDKASLPSDTTSTHSIVRGGVVQLRRWGLLDDVLATGAPAIRSVRLQRYDAGAGEPMTLSVKDKAGVDLVLAPRRYALDAVLAGAAVRAGAQVLDRTTVTGVQRDGRGRVTGVVATGSGGATRILHAGLVVGADGVRSRTAGWFGARTTASYVPSGMVLYTYVAGLSWPAMELHLAHGAFAGVFPTNRGEACVWLMRPTHLAGPLLTAGAERLEAWLAALDATVPDLARRVRAGRVSAPLRGAVGLPNHLRRATGPGWALVGDAGYHRDPITSHGITDAFRDAELLAHSYGAGDLTTYERARDLAVADTFRLTRELGAFPEPARFAELQAELSRALDAEAADLAGLDHPSPRQEHLHELHR